MPSLLSRLFVMLLLGPLLSVGAIAAEQPNFLIILVDDLGLHDLGVEGSTFYETPHIDALANSGMRFEQGYAACQVCSPSRASLMLGKTPARIGITNYIGASSGWQYKRNDPVMPAEYARRLPASDTTIAEALHAAGYKTFYAGKWHLGDKGSWPEDHGFDINKGGWSAGSPNGGYFAPWNNPRLPSGPNGESLAIRLANETAAFVEQHQQQPFFACMAFHHVHSPIQTSKALCEKYRQKAADEGLLDNEHRFQFDRRLPVRQVQDNPIYAGMMETLDDAVGIVLDKLAATGLDKNTVVVFTSDNGGVSSGDAYSTSLLPLRGGKGRQWEGGLRVPLYVRAPGITEPGAVTSVPAIGMDIFPTFLELAGVTAMPEQHLDGVSLVPVLKGETIADRDLFWHYPHYGNQGGEPSSVIRSGDWKLIYYHEDGRVELYNLPDDTCEQTDQAADHPELVRKLRAKLVAWLAETGATFPTADPRFDRQKFEQKLTNSRTKQLEGLEKKHARFLDSDWQPNPTWWGSLPQD
ncbi:sulfatase [Aeoliella mucimassa]|uniref:Arylsulfatase n=1 Tax=Aeoliella mucimassa TaxID=2527972 RepID=A0A518AMS4_9BACT|nr:sulfatase [Aeoliella mucimassa]QDU56013.1 Arylsulfatase [Aeoliella mucimassa]